MDDEPSSLQRALFAQVCRMVSGRVHADDERRVHGAGVHGQGCRRPAVAVGVESGVIGEDAARIGLRMSGAAHRLGLRFLAGLPMFGALP